MSTKLADEERALSGRDFNRRGDRPSWLRLVFVLCVLGLVCGVTAAVLKHLMM